MKTNLFALTALLMLIAVGFAAGQADAEDAATVMHTFSYAPPAGAATVTVSVAGDFNGWKADVNSMARGTDGTYSVTVPVTPGKHYYRIVYDGKWINDPAADKSLEFMDGFGGKNSAFIANATQQAAKSAEPPPVAGGKINHTFRYVPPTGAATVPVSVAADFNSWKADVNALVRGDDGSYSGTFAVPPGRHYYRIVYDGKWINDPLADKSLDFDDGFGGKNSSFIAGDAAPPEPAAANGLINHTFGYVPPAGAATVAVSVAGDFNGWKADVNSMSRGADGNYSVTVPLTPGKHYYRIVYDGKWINDPAADKSLEFMDGFGGKNSGVIIGPSAPPPPAAPSAVPTPVPAANPRTSLKPVDGAPIASTRATMTHTFRYPMPIDTPTVPVSIAGEFSDWKAVNAMTRGSDGVYTVAVDVPEGVHHYKVVYDGKWIADPGADKALDQDDGFGGQNSGFIAGLEANQFPPPLPEAIDAAAVIFNPDDLRDLDVISSAQVRLTLHTRADDVTEAAVMVDGGRTPMMRVSTIAGMNLFSAIVPPHPFFFELKKPGAVAYVASGRAYFQPPGDRYFPPPEPTFVTPEWATHAIWYQILPERFRNGDPGNDPPHAAPWKSKWYDLQPGEKDFYSDIWNRRYGGDLQGVEQELPYLRKLGINAIYLNPIFQSPSLHKYNTSDYRHVDENYGVSGDIEQLKGETDDPATWQWTAGDKVFLDLIAEAHRQGFRIIIDGVYNHVGTQFWAFQDVVKNGQASKYAGWFDIIDWTPAVDKDGHTFPFHYHAWDGINGEAPEWKKDPAIGIVHGPRELILAVARRWLAPDGDPSRGVDGFRLDAPELVPHPFWIDFRQMVKTIKQDALIEGEIWPWAQPWLGGDQFDGVMNYQFAIAAQQFFVNNKLAISPTSLDAACDRLVMNYPFQSALVNQNLLDSHDTDRAASMVVNPDLGFNSHARVQDNNWNYSTRKPNDTERKRLLQEVAFQMTFVGAPMIYYGDEAGMWGAGDPSDRQPMIWQDLGNYDDPDVTFDADQFAYYQKLIAVRRKLPALQIGTYRKLLADDSTNTFAFARDLGNQHAYIVLNRTDQPATIIVPGVGSSALINWMDSASVDLTVTPDRPEVRARGGAAVLPVLDESVRVSLPAYGSAVLAPPMN